ncbi:MAG: hypothetical protein LC721_09880, partial [Actinobacteria bacterium]|nr:hypothetical protein [Actinomycetota bacterium]
GASPSCAILILINPDGSVSVLSDPSVGPYDGAEDTLVGVENQSNTTITSVALSSSQDILGFDGDGICSGLFANTPPPCPLGPTGYEGPNTRFTIVDAFHGTVNFPSGLAPGASTYFSLEERVAAATLVAGPSDRCPSVTPTIVGTNGPDKIVGTSGNDIIFGLGGDDQIDGGAGNDIICGNDGNDSITGGPGNDQIFGDAGDDALSGSTGDDKLFGGPGRDRLSGGDGNDQLNGGADADRLAGDAGNDTLVDTDGLPNDILDGGADADACNASPGDTVVNCNP